MTHKEKRTLVDTVWRWIKNNKIFAFVIVLAGIIIATATFTDNLSKLIKFVDDLIPDKQHTNVVEFKKERASSSFQNYKNNNLTVAENDISDIVTLSRDNIIIDVSLNNEKANVIYVLKNHKNYFEIVPYNDYLMLLKNGGPVNSMNYYFKPFDFQFPTLDFKIVNNSSHTIYFTKAIFSFLSSKPDPFPIIYLPHGYEMLLQIRNGGWGKVYNCIVKFNLVPSDLIANYNEEYRFELSIGDFEEYINKDLTIFFKRCGVKTSVVKEHNKLDIIGYDNDSLRIMDENYKVKMVSEKEYKLEYENALGPFKNGIAKIYGEIFYEGLNISGEIVKEKTRFEGLIGLGNLGAGALIPPSHVYDLHLEMDKQNYKKEIPLSNAIKAGETDRFNIKLYAPKSSKHQFSLVLYYNDNKQFVISDIQLYYFKSKPVLDFYSVPDSLRYSQVP